MNKQDDKCSDSNFSSGDVNAEKDLTFLLKALRQLIRNTVILGECNAVLSCLMSYFCV